MKAPSAPPTSTAKCAPCGVHDLDCLADHRGREVRHSGAELARLVLMCAEVLEDTAAQRIYDEGAYLAPPPRASTCWCARTQARSLPERSTSGTAENPREERREVRFR